MDIPQSASKRLKGIQHQLPNYRAELKACKSKSGEIQSMAQTGQFVRRMQPGPVHLKSHEAKIRPCLK